MTPLGTGPRGYDDLQRIVNWDSPVLTEAENRQFAAAFSTPIFDVGRYGYVLLLVKSGLFAEEEEPLRFTTIWSVDSAGLLVQAGRSVVVDPLLKGSILVRFLNLGPFVKVTFFPKAALTQAVTYRLLGTNRFAPYEINPESAVLLNQSSALGAKAAVTIFPLSYFAGPALLRMTTGVTTGTFKVETATAIGTYVVTAEFRLAANTAQDSPVILPVSAFRVSMENSGAEAATHSVSLIPSTTGST
jgi:hypothetical protein